MTDSVQSVALGGGVRAAFYGTGTDGAANAERRLERLNKGDGRHLFSVCLVVAGKFLFVLAQALGEGGDKGVYRRIHIFTLLGDMKIRSIRPK